MNRLRRKIRRRLADFVLAVVCQEVQIGGHCCLCGKWVSYCLVWVGDGATICDSCLQAGEEKEKGWRRRARP